MLNTVWWLDFAPQPLQYMLFLQVNATKTKRQKLVCRFFVWGHSGPRMSLLEALGHLKSNEWSGWRALEPRLQQRTRRYDSAGGARRNRTLRRQRKQEFSSDRPGSRGQTSRPPVQTSLSVCLFHSFSLGVATWKGGCMCTSRGKWVDLQ